MKWRWPQESDSWGTISVSALLSGYSVCFSSGGVLAVAHHTQNCRISCLICGRGSNCGSLCTLCDPPGPLQSPLRSTGRLMWGVWWPLSESTLKPWMNAAKKIKFEFQPYQSSRAIVYNEESSPCVGGVSLSSTNATILGDYKYEKHTVPTFSFRPIKHYELRNSLHGLTAASFLLTDTFLSNTNLSFPQLTNWLGELCFHLCCHSKKNLLHNLMPAHDTLAQQQKKKCYKKQT